jgi:hypothetical protein
MDATTARRRNDGGALLIVPPNDRGRATSGSTPPDATPLDPDSIAFLLGIASKEPPISGDRRTDLLAGKWRRLSARPASKGQ